MNTYQKLWVHIFGNFNNLQKLQQSFLLWLSTYKKSTGCATAKKKKFQLQIIFLCISP